MTLLKQRFSILNQPISSTLTQHLIDYPTPSNLSYWWGFGSLAGICLVIQIVTGVFLAMHYTPHVDLAFNSVEHIMRDVEVAKLIGTGAATIALAGAAIGIGNVFSSLIHAVVRNPSLAKQLFGYAILAFALTEAIALFALMMAFFVFCGISPDHLLQKVGIVLGGQALSAGLLKVGCPWGLSVCIITLLKSWTWWPNLTCFIIEQDLNAPPGPEVVYLFSDEERREAIRQRFSFLTMSTPDREISPRSLEELLIMERAMEKRLLELGASPDRIVSKWGEIRGIAFPSINGNPLSDQTIHKTYKMFCELGIDQSPPFLKIEKKCRASRLFLTDF